MELGRFSWNPKENILDVCFVFKEIKCCRLLVVLKRMNQLTH